MYFVTRSKLAFSKNLLKYSIQRFHEEIMSCCTGYNATRRALRRCQPRLDLVSLLAKTVAGKSDSQMAYYVWINVSTQWWVTWPYRPTISIVQCCNRDRSATASYSICCSSCQGYQFRVFPPNCAILNPVRGKIWLVAGCAAVGSLLIL